MHKIVFSGEILPGHDPARVRDRLLSMLKLDRIPRVELFSGKSYTLKKGLGSEEADRYVKYLSKRGIGVDVVPPLPSAPVTPFPTLIYGIDSVMPAAEGRVAKPQKLPRASTAAPRAKPIPAPPHRLRAKSSV